jgi:hypothetical protein
MEWNFVFKIMENLGFHCKGINWFGSASHQLLFFFSFESGVLWVDLGIGYSEEDERHSGGVVLYVQEGM